MKHIKYFRMMVMNRAWIFMTCHIFYLTSFSMPKLISTRF